MTGRLRGGQVGYLVSRKLLLLVLRKILPGTFYGTRVEREISCLKGKSKKIQRRMKQ